jgi:predicted acylesterase/phospholipase RssA
MPDKDQERGKIGLAMSGGGYRASLFHLGSLWRLNELGWLRKLDVITSVSGGSIVAAFLGSRWSELEFDDRDDVAKNFEDVFLKPMRTLFGITIDLPTIGQGLLNPLGAARGRVNGKGLAEGLGFFGFGIAMLRVILVCMFLMIHWAAFFTTNIQCGETLSFFGIPIYENYPTAAECSTRLKVIVTCIGGLILSVVVAYLWQKRKKS